MAKSTLKRVQAAKKASATRVKNFVKQSTTINGRKVKGSK